MDKDGTYTLSVDYLCTVRDRTQKQQIYVASLLRDFLNDGKEDGYVIGLLCELYFLNCRLKEQILRYNLDHYEKASKEEEEFIINEPDLLVLRTILFGKHQAEILLSNKNVSVKEN